MHSLRRRLPLEMVDIGCSAVKVFVCNSYDILKAVYERYQQLLENNEHRNRVMQSINHLRQMLDEINSDLLEFPSECNSGIDNFKKSMNICATICNQLESKGFFKNFIDVATHKNTLRQVESELENAQKHLSLVLQIANLKKTSFVQKTVKECGDRTEAAAIHSSAGVFRGDSSKILRPQCLPRPQVNVDRDLLVVRWSDKTNSIVARYEVRYNDERSMIVSGTPDELQTDHDSIFAMKIGPPRITAGQLCTVQVRAANSQGLGEWSEAVVCRYKKGVPNKPKKPRLTIESPTNITITVQLLKEDETNGSPVTQCIVEHFAENITSNWERLTYNIKQRSPIPEETNFTINCLVPHTTYIFRVRMVNEVGESEQSESVQVITEQFIPGPPQELRVSSKRSDKSIKIRWKEPAANAQAVIQYEAEFVAEKSKSQEWSILKTTKLSAKANDLKPDTKYKFRVRAVNHKGEYGDYSDEVIAETRVGEGAQVAAAIGAFVGGTVGGPLIGALGFGMMAGDSASDHPDSTVGKVAAGTAAGIGGGVAGALIGTVGAPLFGGASSYMAYKKLEGKLDDVSPQSSEDEEEESVYIKALKMKTNESKNK